MKKLLLILITFFTLAFTEKVQSQVYTSVSFNTFYNELSPYGQWIDYPQYGRVWVYNRAGFRPYYDDGHWEYTNYGWAWVSDMPWGWAPFHYGRWAYIPAYGWAWVPGYEWAPAWVGWVQNSGYYGWAPLSPGLGINISFGSIPRDRWCFVPNQYIGQRNIRNHYVNPVNNVNVYNNVTVINNTQVNNNVTYVTGPQKADVERFSRKKIEPKSISFASAPGRTVVKKKEINIYRPDQNKTTIPSNPATENGIDKNKVPAAITKPVAPIERKNIIPDNNVKNNQPIRIKPQKTEQVNQPNIQADKVQQQQDAQRMQEQNKIKQQQLQNAQRQQAEQQKMQQKQQIEIRQREQQTNRPVQKPATFQNRQNNTSPGSNKNNIPRRRF